MLLLTYQNNNVPNISSDTVPEFRAHNSNLLLGKKRPKACFLNFAREWKYSFSTNMSSVLNISLTSVLVTLPNMEVQESEVKLFNIAKNEVVHLK